MKNNIRNLTEFERRLLLGDPVEEITDPVVRNEDDVNEQARKELPQRKDPRKRWTARRLKRAGFSNGLWRIDERVALAKWCTSDCNNS